MQPADSRHEVAADPARPRQDPMPRRNGARTSASSDDAARARRAVVDVAGPDRPARPRRSSCSSESAGPRMPVDTHVHRVTTRLGMLPPRTPLPRDHDLLEEVLQSAEMYPISHVETMPARPRYVPRASPDLRPLPTGPTSAPSTCSPRRAERQWHRWQEIEPKMAAALPRRARPWLRCHRKIRSSRGGRAGRSPRPRQPGRRTPAGARDDPDRVPDAEHRLAVVRGQRQPVQRVGEAERRSDDVEEPDQDRDGTDGRPGRAGRSDHRPRNRSGPGGRTGQAQRAEDRVATSPPVIVAPIAIPRREGHEDDDRRARRSHPRAPSAPGQRRGQEHLEPARRLVRGPVATSVAAARPARMSPNSTKRSCEEAADGRDVDVREDAAEQIDERRAICRAAR